VTWDLYGITWLWTESDAVIAKRARTLYAEAAL